METHFSCDACGYALAAYLAAVKVDERKLNDVTLVLRCPMCNHIGNVSLKSIVATLLDEAKKEASGA